MVCNFIFVKISFNKSFLFIAYEEAKDTRIYLKPLRMTFDDLEQIDFYDLSGKLSITMHLIFTVWCNSKYYNMPNKIIVLLQEVCNLLINKVIHL